MITNTARTLKNTPSIQRCAHAERDIAGMLLADAYDGQALVFGLAAFLRLAEVGGFKDMHTDIEGHAHQDHAEQKQRSASPMP